MLRLIETIKKDFEDEINRNACSLYRLTENEIAVVERVGANG
jgi:hypothetical protein